MAAWFVYILSSEDGRYLYTGQTNDLRRRIAQHRAGAVEAWTAEHATYRLVYFETHGTLRDALTREKAIKRWRRAWKENPVASRNPGWCDLTNEIPL